MKNAPSAAVVDVELVIDAAELLRYYRGEVKEVLARARDGRAVCFPVQALRPFVTAAGVRGRFRIHFDAAQRLLDVERIG